MAKGRTGFYLEGWKFAVYLGIPLLASWYYGDPRRQKEAAEYWKYITYPANPNVNMKQSLQEMQRQQEQRAVYRDQLRQLQQQAAKSTTTSTSSSAANTSSTNDNAAAIDKNHLSSSEAAAAKPRSWLRFVGLGGGAKSQD